MKKAVSRRDFMKGAAVVAASAVLTGCSGEKPLTWENSKTNQYFKAHGVTAEKYEVEGELNNGGNKATVILSRDGEKARFETQYETQGVGYLTDGKTIYMKFNDEGYVKANGDWYDTNAPTLIPMIQKGGGVFVVPTAKTIVSVSSGTYPFNGKDYKKETFEINDGSVVGSYNYCFEGNELKFIITSTQMLTITKISASPTFPFPANK